MNNSRARIAFAFVALAIFSLSRLGVAQPVPAGIVYGWGQGDVGQTGILGDATNIVAISAGYNHVLALKSDGTVESWGEDYLGETSVPDGLTNVIAVAAGDNHSLALKSDGTVVAWGYNGYGEATVPAGLSNVVAIAAGDFFSLALRSNGTVAAWGDDGNSQVDEANYATGITAIAANPVNTSFAVGLKSDGTIVVWGIFSPPVPATKVVQVSVGGAHYLGLTTNGTVVAWGDNTYGQTNVPAGLSNVVAIAAGWNNSMALKADGTVVVWGDNSYGEGVNPLGLTNVTAISSGGGYNLVLNNGLPSLLAWPTNQSAYTGMSVTFNADGPSSPVPFYYQWQFNGTNITGATGNTLSLTNLQLTDAGIYTAVVTNVYGAVTSSASLSVTSSVPIIQQQPADQMVPASSNGTFSVIAAGTFPLNYQWQCNSTNIPGETNASLVVSNAQLSQNGLVFDVVVSNSVNVTISSNAVLFVVPSIVSIQPQNLTTNGGANVTFTSTVSGAGPLAYQWQFNGTNITDATNGTLVLSSALDSDSGAYDLLVSNSFGGATSSNAILTVIPTIGITVSPSVITNGEGTLLIISFGIPGLSQPFTYSWTLNGNPFGGPPPGGALEGIDPPPSLAGIYTVTASNAYHTLTTNTTLTIVPLSITSPPQSRSAWIGGSVRFTVSAVGVPPIGYQWQSNGVPIPGANTNSLLLTNVTASAFGPYNVIVSNSYLSVTSSVAMLSLSQVAVWGGNDGETNLIADLTNIVGIAAGGSGALDCQVLRSDGTVTNWPVGSHFVVSNLVSIMGAQPTLGLKTNGTVLYWFYDSPAGSSGTNVAAIGQYYYGYLLLKTDGTVTGSAATAAPAGLSNVVAVAEGNGHSLALRANGTVVGWGNNSSGQANPPPNLSNVVAIAAGYSHSLALKSDGTVVAWGNNAYGQTNVPIDLTNHVIAIAAGAYHSMALSSNGIVRAWGMNTYGQCNVPANLSNVVAIAGGEFHSMALIRNSPPALQVPLSNPTQYANGFKIVLPTQSGRTYVLQYENSLLDNKWISLPLIPGNGKSMTLMDTTATNSQRFYRVQQW